MVYADNAATTKMSRTAIDAMLPYHGDPLRQPLQPVPAWGRRPPEALQQRTGDRG